MNGPMVEEFHPCKRRFCCHSKTELYAGNTENVAVPAERRGNNLTTAVNQQETQRWVLESENLSLIFLGEVG